MLSLDEYYKENFDSLVKKINRVCNNYHDAEDIVQDAFERAVKYSHTCNDMEKWFSVILRNTYRDFIRKRMKWPVTKPVDEHLDEIEPVIIDFTLPSMVTSIDELVSQEKEPNKTIIILHISYGFTQGEIACLVENTSIGHVNNVLNRFKQRAIKRLK